jgi:hypothetical protein
MDRGDEDDYTPAKNPFTWDAMFGDFMQDIRTSVDWLRSAVGRAPASPQPTPVQAMPNVEIRVLSQQQTVNFHPLDIGTPPAFSVVIDRDDIETGEEGEDSVLNTENSSRRRQPRVYRMG